MSLKQMNKGKKTTKKPKQIVKVKLEDSDSEAPSNVYGGAYHSPKKYTTSRSNTP